MRTRARAATRVVDNDRGEDFLAMTMRIAVDGIEENTSIEIVQRPDGSMEVIVTTSIMGAVEEPKHIGLDPIHAQFLINTLIASRLRRP